MGTSINNNMYFTGTKSLRVTGLTLLKTEGKSEEGIPKESFIESFINIFKKDDT